jgi:predicted DNA-binding transcriptional regulator AlpA
MAKPKLEYIYEYLTSPQVCRKLGIGRSQLDQRIKRGIFPQPTLIAPSGVRYFDANWIILVKDIIKNAPSRRLDEDIPGE